MAFSILPGCNDIALWEYPPRTQHNVQFQKLISYSPSPHPPQKRLEWPGGGGAICKASFLNYTLTAGQSSHLEPLNTPKGHCTSHLSRTVIDFVISCHISTLTHLGFANWRVSMNNSFKCTLQLPLLVVLVFPFLLQSPLVSFPITL